MLTKKLISLARFNTIEYDLLIIGQWFTIFGPPCIF